MWPSMTYFISQIYMDVMLHSEGLSLAPTMSYFISQFYMGVMLHSGCLSVAVVHGWDVALWATKCGLL